VDATRALADLVEISPQIEAAVVVAGDGEPAGAIGVADARASVLARAVRELLDGAAGFRAGRSVTQLHARVAGGDVFAVAGTGGQVVAAVASRRGAPGLVFYDLKQCLARLDEEAGG
jgi:hypothetical protein